MLKLGIIVKSLSQDCFHLIYWFQPMLKQPILMKEDALRKQSEQALLSCLKEIPFLRIKKIKAELKNGELRPDLMIQCLDGREEKILIIEAKESGQPKSARDAINQLLVYLNAAPKSYAIFSAPYISPQTAAMCLKSGIGYLDLAGNCSLQFDQVFIKKEGNPNPFSEKRDLRSLYSPKAERALRALLNQPKLSWKVTELRVAADISLGQAHNVKKLLLDREWLKMTKNGFQLAQPGALLKEWSENYDFRRNTVNDFYSMLPLPELEAKLAVLCEKEKLPYAFTGLSGSARVASSGRYQRATAYVETDDLAKLVKDLGLKEVASGANLTILTPYDAGVFYGKTPYDGAQVVGPIQLYLDLLGFRGRGEEAAALLLEKVIEPLW